MGQLKCYRKYTEVNIEVSFIIGINKSCKISNMPFTRRQSRKKFDDDGSVETLNLTLGSVGPRRFCYGELASATSNFSDESKLCQGGFGALYKGYLMDLDILVVVKKISKGSK